MSELSFCTYDVFTDRRFGGNPLAVVLDGGTLEPGQMQTLAREFNVSETAFLVAATRGDCALRLRIFTPLQELPFAGHPIVGTACALADLGLLPGSGNGGIQVQVETGIGPIPVRIHRSADGTTHAELTLQRPPELGPQTDDPTELAAALDLQADDLHYRTERPRVASSGVPFLLVPLRSPETLAGVDVDIPRLGRLLPSLGARGVYLYARGYEGELRCRMFWPGLGEDPATGSAAAALAARLTQDALAAGESSEGDHRWTLTQGLEINRPSRIEVAARTEGGRIVAIRVGGYAVPVMSGTLHATP